MGCHLTEQLPVSQSRYRGLSQNRLPGTPGDMRNDLAIAARRKRCQAIVKIQVITARQ